MRTGKAKLLAAALAATLVLVAGCGGGSETTATMPFEPQATLHAIGGTRRPAKPDLVLTVQTRPGDANISSAHVELPPVALVDATSIRSICGRKELESSRCAGKQSLGTSRVVSPSLARPLTGPVYVVSGPGRQFHLAYVLGGPLHLLLEGKIESKGGRIAAGVEEVPDTPMKSFELRIAGGKSGYLVLDRDICHGNPTATATFTSQEGQTHEEQVPLLAECG